MKDLYNNCDNSNSNIMKKVNIIATTQILIAKLHLFDHDSSGTTKVENFSIKAIPTTKIQMGDLCYKLKKAIFHHGKRIADGHYTSMVRGKGTTWISVDNLRVEKKLGHVMLKMHTYFSSKGVNCGCYITVQC